MSGSPYRDEGLGTALRCLGVPEHGPNFYSELEARLVTAKRRRLPSQRRLVAVAAGLAVAVAVAVGILSQVGVHGSGVARAAEIEARMATAISRARTASGELTYTALDDRSRSRVTTHQSFALDASGDQRLTDTGARTVSAFDVRAGVERSITTSASIGSGKFYAERDGLAPGPPDPTAASSLLDTQLGAIVRAFAAAHDSRVQELDYQGRPAWRLELHLRPNTIYPDVDHLSVVVDRASGLPLRVLATLDGRFRSELRLERLRLDRRLTRRTFSVGFPSGVEVLRSDAGFANVTLGEARSIVGYRPLVPANVPTGFVLTAVAAAGSAAATGPAETNPPSRGVVSLSYRRGLEQVVVTTRLRGDGRWRDPFAVEGVPLNGEQIRLRHGPLAGSSAGVVVDPRAIPHLWTVAGRLVITVAGDLSRDELVAVAEALR